MDNRSSKSYLFSYGNIFDQAQMVKTEITFETFKSHTTARITTFITWRMGLLALVNKSEGMFVHVKRVSPPKLDIWIFPKNASRMSS